MNTMNKVHSHRLDGPVHVIGSLTNLEEKHATSNDSVNFNVSPKVGSNVSLRADKGVIRHQSRSKNNPREKILSVSRESLFSANSNGKSYIDQREHNSVVKLPQPSIKSADSVPNLKKEWPRADEPVIYRSGSVRPSKASSHNSLVSNRVSSSSRTESVAKSSSRVNSSASVREDRFEASDSSTAKNALVMYISTLQHQLERPPHVFLDRLGRLKLRDLIEDTKLWLKHNGHHRPAREYESRLRQLQATIDDLDVQMNRAETAIADYKKWLEKIRHILSIKRYEDITLSEAQLRQLRLLLIERDDWLITTLDETEAKKNQVSLEELLIKTGKLHRDLMDIIYQPEKPNSSISKETRVSAREYNTLNNSFNSLSTRSQSPRSRHVSFSGTNSPVIVSSRRSSTGYQLSDFSTFDDYDSFRGQLPTRTKITIIHAPRALNSTTKDYICHTSPEQRSVELLDLSSEASSRADIMNLSEITELLLQYESYIAQETKKLLATKYEVFSSHDHPLEPLNREIKRIHKEIQYYAESTAHGNRLLETVNHMIDTPSYYTPPSITELVRAINNFQTCGEDDLRLLKRHLKQCQDWLQNTADRVDIASSKVYECARDDLSDYEWKISDAFHELSDKLDVFVIQLKGRKTPVIYEKI